VDSSKLYIVSVFLLTYNQEDYISETIESIVGQRTNFKYQLVIGEDCSSDTTRSICEKYAQKYPDKIKLLPALEKNIGLIANYMRTIKQCEGKYIAICDGDDYWTDMCKLQKQVDFMGSNPNFAIVYTNYTKLFPDGRLVTNAIHYKKRKSNFNDLIENNFIPSVTALFVNRQHQGVIPSWIAKYPYGDWPTYLWTIRDKGEVGFIDEDMAIYRMDIGASARLIKRNSKLLKVNISILTDMYRDPSFIINKDEIACAMKRRMLELMTSYNREKMFVDGLKHFFKNISHQDKSLSVIKLYIYSLWKNLN
jgi:glycosyltransferase involved in cell wall biosynthesis